MTSRNRTTIAGRRAFVGHRDEIVAGGGFVSGEEGTPQIELPGNVDRAAVFEDYLGADLGATASVAGDTGPTDGIVAGTGGLYRLHNADSSANGLHSRGSGISTAALQFKGNQGSRDAGPLKFSARVRVEEIGRGNNRVHVFAGFTDVASYEFPAFDTGGGLQGIADDFLGFIFSPGGDTGLSAVAGNGGTDQVLHLDTGIEDNAFVTLEVEYHRGGASDSGEAEFFVNGVSAGTIKKPISDLVGLAAGVWAFNQDTGSRYVDVDYINVGGPRDTGS